MSESVSRVSESVSGVSRKCLGSVTGVSGSVLGVSRECQGESSEFVWCEAVYDDALDKRYATMSGRKRKHERLENKEKISVNTLHKPNVVIVYTNMTTTRTTSNVSLQQISCRQPFQNL